jgi:hypothetical protein
MENIYLTHQPLYTQPALDYLNSIIDPKWKVFEYGGGFSTVYYNKNCSRVYTTEHDKSWGKVVTKIIPDAKIEIVTEKVEVIPNGVELYKSFISKKFILPLRDDKDRGYNSYHGLTNDEFLGYASRICNFRKGYFDVVIVDGMCRSLCLFYTVNMINDKGIIILDNSCRWQYNDLQSYLIDNGFNRKDFWQPDHASWCTSFFSKSYDRSTVEPRRPVNTGDLYHVY